MLTTGSLNTADYLVARADPDAVAVVDGAHRHSYAELVRAAGLLAAELRDLGLEPGARVGLLGPNSFFWVAGYLAVLRLGLVAVPLPDKIAPGDVRRDLDLVGSTAVLVDRRVQRGVAAALDGLPVVTDAALDASIDADREPYWPAPAPVDLDADAALMFTSGSTSIPQAVRVTHRNLQANTESIIGCLGLRADDRVLVILPFSYCYGASLLHTHLRVGGRVVLCHSFVFPTTALDLLVREACTVFAGVPSSFQLLLRAGDYATRALPTLRIVQQAGGKLAPVLVEALLLAQPAARLFLMYGQTEATARLSCLPPEELPARATSIGKGIPGVELRVLDDAGRPVSPGERGEIYARGASISPGYYGDPVATASRFTAEGLRTGDLAVVDDEGFVHVVDRREDFIKSWGYRVSSHEVEACALRVEELVSAAAIGVPDDAAGEAVALFVTARSGAEVTADDVLAVCRRHLPKHMLPATVAVLDALPLTASGKVAKPVLRELAARAAGPDDSERGKVMTVSRSVTAGVTTAELVKVARTRVFFGHQSVGDNLLAGLPGVFAAHGIPAPSVVEQPFVEQARPPEVPGGFVEHALVGANGHPHSKLRAFDAAIRGGVGARVDVAMMKFCHADVTASTDVDALFDDYRATMARLERDFPEVAFVKVTVPVTTEPGPDDKIKSVVKKLLGREVAGRGDNVARERLNALIRRSGAGTHLFDLAAAESTAPDGSRSAGTEDGRPYLALADGYALDEGHLNEAGARAVATAWLAAVAEASSR